MYLHFGNGKNLCLWLAETVRSSKMLILHLLYTLAKQPPQSCEVIGAHQLSGSQYCMLRPCAQKRFKIKL